MVFQYQLNGPGKGTWTNKTWRPKRESQSLGSGYPGMTCCPPASAPILPLSLLRQQALLYPGPGQATSHIFYEPDACDGLDQEDPDDDLDI